MNKLLIIGLVVFGLNAFAESAKVTKVDLDVKTTHIIKADLDVDDHYYYIDSNACICWVTRVIGGTPTLSTFDCAKLAAHPRLEQYVSRCVAAKPVEIKVGEATENKPELKDIKEESNKVLKNIEKKDNKKKK